MRVLALGGAGAVAKESTWDLAQFSDFDEIVIAEYNVEAGEKLIAEIDDPRLKVMPFDASDYDAMLRVFSQFDVVMNGLPFQYDMAVTRACVEVGVPGCDLSSCARRGRHSRHHQYDGPPCDGDPRQGGDC
jgi:saccharopine dehydrogenase-like NADP-dependent oxidoreductase